MPRFYLPPDSWDPEHFALSGPEAHHCVDVLRMKAGERATLFNGLGLHAQVELVCANRQRVEFRCVELRQAAAPGCRITLGQAIPKGKNMELILEKATELGAGAIAPLLTARTVVQLDARDSARKQEKWQRVALEAAKQCGQNWLPTVHQPQTLASFFETHPAGFDLMLIGSLESDARLLKTVLAERSGQRPASALILIGPEGDFTPGELALARSRGCAPLTFGPIILRTETAAIYCLSVLAHELLGL